MPGKTLARRRRDFNPDDYLVYAGIAILLGAVVFVAAMIHFSRDPSPAPPTPPAALATDAPPPASSDDAKVAAWVAAEQFVKARLKSPSTASFGSPFGDWQDPRAQTQDMGDGSYQCAGWVDAQNSFGALIRSQFICVVRPQAGSYTCDYCDVWSE